VVRLRELGQSCLRRVARRGHQTSSLARQGGAPAEGDLALQLSKQFWTVVAGVTGDEWCATLLTLRGAAGLASDVVSPSGVGANHVVNALVSVVRASATPIETLPDLDAAPEVGWLDARPDGSVSRDTQGVTTETSGDPARLDHGSRELGDDPFALGSPPRCSVPRGSSLGP